MIQEQFEVEVERIQPAIKSRCEVRLPGDDFFCLRYQVHYSSLDCAIRTEFQTSNGCAGCEQGRFNLKRHAGALRHPSFRFFQAGNES